MFYNFSRDRIAKALPAAWEFASPADALRVREESAVAALRRYGVTDDNAVRTAAELAAKATSSAPLDGRPLFAANLAQRWSDEPLAKLWRAVTLPREQRGDGHVAVLASRRQRRWALVAMTSTTTTPTWRELAQHTRRPRVSAFVRV